MAAWCMFVTAATGANGPQGSAQNAFVIKTWQTEDGLPENSATAMVQTQDGYLWFGTFNGLVRFDGANFAVFDPGNTPELPSPGVVNLHLDRHDRLWVSTLRGLVVREGNRWRRFDQSATRENEFVRSFAERSNGDLLLTFFNGKILEFTGDQLIELPSPPGEPDSGYLGACDEDGRWWVAQRTFVGTWNGNQWLTGHSVTNIPAPQGSALGLAPARDGGFWLLVGTDLRKYSRGRQVSIRPVADDQEGSLGSISRMTEDSSGNVWIATFDAGLTQVLPDGRIRRWSETNGLAYKDVRFVFEDREKNVWVGTSGGGLQRFRPRRFQSFGYTQGEAARVVYSVAAGPDGSVWATTFGQGLFRWGPETGFSRTKPPSFADHYLHFTSVLADRKGRTWVGVYDDGLIAFGAGYDRHFTAPEIGGAIVNALFEDSRGRIWISAGPGLAVFDDSRIEIYDGKNGLPPGNVCAMAEDATGALWVSNQESVFRLNSGRFEEVSAGRPARGVTCLKGDRDGTMWMGSLDQGLLRWRAETLVIIDAHAGLPARGIHGVLEDARGNFWMASDRGVVRAARSTLSAVADGNLAKVSCQLLDLGDGLPSVECPAQRQPVCARDARGRLWFATAKGVAFTDPDSFELNSVPPPVSIEAIEYLVPSKSPSADRLEPRRITAPFAEHLKLPAGSREIAIHYTAASFAAPDKVRFQVKFEGEGFDWHSGEGTRVEHFHAPPPGDYVFRVRAANNDGVWNETGTSLAFTVLPYYWQTWWFRLTTALLLVGSGVLVAWMQSRSRVLRALERERVASEIQELREKLAHSNRVSSMGQLASALAHELSQPLGAILRNAEAGELLLDQAPPDLPEVRAILNDIRQDDQRAAGVIDRMRGLLKRGKVERIQLSLLDLFREVETLTRPEALQRKVQVRIDVLTDLPPVLGDRVQVGQVLLNLVLNSMDAMNDVPPENRTLIIQARRAEEHMIEVSVRDSGPGIPAENLRRLFEPFFTTKPHGMGIGLAICRTIIETHGGRLRAENNPGAGACFSFSLPEAGSTEHGPAEK